MTFTNANGGGPSEMTPVTSTLGYSVVGVYIIYKCNGICRHILLPILYSYRYKVCVTCRLYGCVYSNIKLKPPERFSSTRTIGSFTSSSSQFLKGQKKVFGTTVLNRFRASELLVKRLFNHVVHGQY